MIKFHHIVITLIVGIVIGWLCRPNRVEYLPIEQVDTVYKTEYYSRLELANNTYKLNIPKIGAKEYVYVDSDSIKTIYKDSIKYVMLPREYSYTKIKDVEIWHSGIDSRIDSLNLTQQTTTIHKTERVKYHPKNRLSAGAEVHYFQSAYTPIYLEYERMLHKNVGIFAKFLYDIPNNTKGVGVGVEFTIGW